MMKSCLPLNTLFREKKQNTYKKMEYGKEEKTRKTEKRYKLMHKPGRGSRSRLTELPDDILYYIAEFIAPLCSKERFNMLTDTIIPSLPEFSRYFSQNTSTYCSLEDHIYIKNTTICIHEMKDFIHDENLRKSYFQNIIQDLTCQKQLNVTCEKARYNLENQHYELDYYLDNTNTFTYHFNNNQQFDKDHPLMQFIIQKILPLTSYRFSHMCCSGSGIFCNEIM